MMAYHIIQVDYKRESLGDYKYKIFENELCIANYWHDFRGDDHGIDFISGQSINSIPCLMTGFLSGGGPSPFSLTKFAVEFIENHKA